MSVHLRCGRGRAVVTIAAALTVFAGCGSSSSSSPSATAPTTTSTAAQVVATSMRTKRYCEVLLVRIGAGGATADVYNTYPLNDCPAAKWTKLVPKTIAAAEGFPIAILNGPRYWLMDSVEKTKSPAQIRKVFGGLTMIRQASLVIGSIAAATKPYTLHRVNRSTVFTFDAGTTVYELTTADGATYVMQSWSQQVDPNLSAAQLAGLGARLHLPAGWTYRARPLTAPLRVVTKTADAEVLQDDFKNTYSRETGN